MNFFHFIILLFYCNPEVQMSLYHFLFLFLFVKTSFISKWRIILSSRRSIPHEKHGSSSENHQRTFFYIPLLNMFRTLSRAVSRTGVRNFKVAVLGASGGIGQPLALLLKLEPLVTELALFDVVRTPGVAADISHCCTKATVQISLQFLCVTAAEWILRNRQSWET